MNCANHDRLLDEILAGEELTSFRESSLKKTLALARFRRRRQVLRASLVVALPILVVVVFVLHETGQGPSKVALSVPARETQASSPPDTASPPRAGGVKYITEQELFALFPDRPLALIGPPGHQRLVFFDEPKDQASRGQTLDE